MSLEYVVQASSPILSRGCQALESAQKLAQKFVPYETALQRLWFLCLVHRRIRGDPICMYTIMHGLLDFPRGTVFVAPPALGFEVMRSRFTNRVVKTRVANMRSAFE